MTENIDPNDIEDCQKHVFDLEAEVRELRAALERARALLKRIEWQDATTRPIYCDIVVCVACGRDHPNHKPDCELSALLVLAGEARP